MKRRLILAAGAAAVTSPAWVHAQSAWPSRPVRLIAQFPPGGLVDTVARLMGPHLSQAIGQPVIVENRAGAGGLIGTDYASKQAADGYTLLVSHASVHVYATATRSVMPFDAVNDFTHMAMLVEAPMVLLVRAQSPYQGSAPAMQDLLGGNIDCLFDPVTTNVAQLKAGSLRALAVSTPARLPAMPSIPTFAEAGFPAPTGSQWLGLSAPKNLPAPIAQRLMALMPEILAKPDIAARLEDIQTLPRKTPVVGAEFVSLIRSQIDTWSKVAKRAKVEVVV